MTGLVFKGFSYADILANCGMIHTAGDMVINFKALRITKAGHLVDITKNEWKYLAVLIGANGNLVNRETLYRIVAGINAGTTRTVDTFISMLRRKMGAHIETVWGLGYRWASVAKEPVKKVKILKAQKPPRIRVVKIKESNETTIIPARKIERMIMDSAITSESQERIYRIRGTFVQWNGEEEIPKLIAAFEKAHGELPSFITLPVGHIRFMIESRPVIWPGSGPLPIQVLHHLDEFQTLPPWTRVEPNTKRKRAA